jgi:hypothetical protein
MGDWTEDASVIAAIRAFHAAQAHWRRVAPADGRLPANPSQAQQFTFARMREADRDYVWARDAAIHRAR